MGGSRAISCRGPPAASTTPVRRVGPVWMALSETLRGARRPSPALLLDHLDDRLHVAEYPAACRRGSCAAIVFSHISTIAPVSEISLMRDACGEDFSSSPMPLPKTTSSNIDFVHAVLALDVAHDIERLGPGLGVAIADLDHDARLGTDPGGIGARACMPGTTAEHRDEGQHRQPLAHHTSHCLVLLGDRVCTGGYCSQETAGKDWDKYPAGGRFGAGQSQYE